MLWLVDLAGCECAGKLNTTGDVSKSKLFEEGVNINKGLLALGKVLTARAANLQHVPYRYVQGIVVGVGHCGVVVGAGQCDVVMCGL